MIPWDHIAVLHTIDQGPTAAYPEGHLETPKAWVEGDWDDDGILSHPLTVTFEPIGCGRVLYSTYHTADNTHVGLVPQERVLMHLVMEIGVCSNNPVVQ